MAPVRATLAVALATAGLVAGGSLSAQEAPVPRRVTVSITASTLGFGSLQRQPILADRIEDDVVTGNVLLQRTVTADGGIRGNVAVAVDLDASWSVRLGAGTGRVRLDDAYAGADEWTEAAREARHDGERSVSVMGVEAALRFRVPSAHAFRPYIELGIAAERWHADTTPEAAFPGSEGLLDALTRVGGHAAVGGSYPVTGRLGVRLQASTRVFRTPVPLMAAGVEVGRSDTLVLTTAPAVGHGFADSAIELVQSTRLELGLSYIIAGAAVARSGRSGSSGTPTVPRR